MCFRSLGCGTRGRAQLAPIGSPRVARHVICRASSGLKFPRTNNGTAKSQRAVSQSSPSANLVQVFGLWWTGVAILSATLSALGWFPAKPLFDWACYSRMGPGFVAVVLVTAFTTGTVIGAVGLGVHQFMATRMSLQ